MDTSRYCYSAGFGDLLKPGSYVDPVAQNVISVDDDVAQVDANAEGDAAVFVDVTVAFGHALLHDNAAFDCRHDGRKFQQQSVAHGLDDTAAVAGDGVVDHFVAMGA